MIQLNFTTHKPISAIYYALLQCGYEFYHLERDRTRTEQLRQFTASDVPAFFREVKQTTCDIYPYWPRTAILESATFHLTPDMQSYTDFDAFAQTVKNASNLTDAERTQELLDWLASFPRALTQVLHSKSFARYFEWETAWISKQQAKYQTQLQEIHELLSRCADKYGSPMARVRIVQNPIKCVYSADYHVISDCLTVVSGTLDLASVVHEFLHTVVHPYVLSNRDAIQNNTRSYTELDASYLSAGKLNAFEEYVVRKLTDAVLNGELPDLQTFLE